MTPVELKNYYKALEFPIETETVEGNDLDLEIVTRDGKKLFKIKVDDGVDHFVFIPVGKTPVFVQQKIESFGPEILQ